MGRTGKISSHFHIRWGRNPQVDWESFLTHEEADARARELMRPGETYTIEEFDHACERCSPPKSVSAR